MIIKDNKKLKQNDFKNEKELQTYFENNMKSILGYTFVETEFTVGNFRIDTLVFDEEINSFKIIEYKNVKNHSLVDQGYTYLKLLLERKADFVLKYNEKTGKQLLINEVDWSQSRILFVSPIFTNYQLNATDFKNIPIDLYRVCRYEEDIVDIELIQKTSSTKVEEMIFDDSSDEVSREVKVYTEEDHLNHRSEKVQKMYEEIKRRVLELDDIDVDVKKMYIAFKGATNIIDVGFKKNEIRIYINMKKGTLDDPLNITRDISEIGHWGNGDYWVTISEENDIDAVLPLIKQSLIVNKK